jgi:hypothetical protein
MQMTCRTWMGDFLPADVQPTPVWTEMAFGRGFWSAAGCALRMGAAAGHPFACPLAVLRQDALEERLRRRRDPVRLGLFAALGTSS